MSSQKLVDQLRRIDPGSDAYATAFVDLVLDAACQTGVSDVHLQPTSDGLSLSWRQDGVLQPLGGFPSGAVTDVVARLKVLAGLLTYRADVPQEGRLRRTGGSWNALDMRVSTFPSLHGERAVIRLFAIDEARLYLDQLQFPEDVQQRLRLLLGETSGAIIVTGPAGSGKSTTAYACLRELVRSSSGGRCLVSIEDPIEVPIDGVSQSQVNSSAGFDLTSGLKSLLRQDPEVILVGEIRDRETAAMSVQAALTGQLLVTTFHAGSSAEAVSRLSDMGIESYLLRSAILAILSQRLVRRLCTCSQEIDRRDDLLGLDVSRARKPGGCQECGQTGYRGRMPLVELLTIDSSQVRRSVLAKDETVRLQRAATEAGMVTLAMRACLAIESGWTSPTEVRRVLGFIRDA